MTPSILSLVLGIAGVACFVLFTGFLYAYHAYSLMVLARKTDTPNGILAWIPLANLFLMVQVGGKPWWWVLLFFIPLINIIFIVFVWVSIAEAVEKEKWWGIMVIVPIMNLIMPGYLAFSASKKQNKINPTPFVLLGVSIVSLVLALVLFGISAFTSGKGLSLDAVRLPSFLTSTLSFQTSAPQNSVTISAGTEEARAKEERLNRWRANSVEYWNCEYWYVLRYPTSWTNNGMTDRSGIVKMEGEGASMSIEAFPNMAGMTLEEFASDRKAGLVGTENGSRDKMRNGVRIIAYEMKDPFAIIVLWQKNNFFMEFRLESKDNTLPPDTAQNIVLTLNTNPSSLPACSGQTAIQSQQQVSDIPCDHPNGDVEYWWWDVSQDIRDCYTQKYGAPAFLTTLQNPQNSKTDCSFPNGDVAEWWETVPQATRDCFVAMYGQPQFAQEGGDVPDCDYENDPDCWPAGEYPGSSIDSTDHPNGDIEFW